MRRLAAVVLVVAMFGCSSNHGSDGPAPAEPQRSTSPPTPSTAASPAYPDGIATSLAEAKGRGYRSVAFSDTDVWVDDEGGWVYFESDDCEKAMSGFEYTNPQDFGSNDVYRLRCFEDDAPTTATTSQPGSSLSGYEDEPPPPRSNDCPDYSYGVVCW